MREIINILLLGVLIVSLSMNIFLWCNNEVNCDNIDARWKADILYQMGHRNLDGDKDGIACENLPYNNE